MFIRALSTATSSSTARAASITHPTITQLSPSVTKIHLAPSVPVHIAYGSLLSINAGDVTAVSISNFYLHPLKRILQGLHQFRFERVESTVPASLLVSSSSKGKASGHVLSLDGTRDWAVLPRDAILAYAGASLRIDTLALPAEVSKKGKWYQFASKVKTGLPGAFRPGYSLVSGRGDVVLRGEGEILSVDLGEGDEVLVKRANIVGISVEGDLAEASEKYQLTKVEEKKEIVVDNEAKEVVETKEDPLKVIKESWNFVVKNVSGLVRWISENLPTNDEYIKILGPRKVLLKSQIVQANWLTLREKEAVVEKEQ